MQVTNVTREDAIACAQLLKALRAARFNNLSAEDMEAFTSCTKWLQSLGLAMAEKLKTPASPPPPAEDQTMRVKNMGPIGGSPAAPKKSSTKKK